MGDGKFQCNTQLRSGGDEVPGKITVRNYTTLTDYAALLRAGMYLAGKKEEAEDNGFRFKVTESERHGVVVKIAEVDKRRMERSRHWHKRSFCRIPGWILKSG